MLTSEMVRTAVKSFGASGQEVSNAQLYDALALQGDDTRAILRSRLNDMVKSGELIKTRPGIYTYNVKYRPREGRGYNAIWRYVRKAKPGWSISDCALMTHVDATHAARYCAWLEDEGYIERVGLNARRAVTYRATQKADATPEPPYPPTRPKDTYEKERVAAATIVRAMLCEDMESPRARAKIADCARTLLTRFCMENENEPA